MSAADPVDPCGLIDPGAHWHLSRWADWMRGYSMHLGYPRRAAGLCSPASKSYDEMVEIVDRRDCAVADAVVGSLTMQHQAAVHHVYLAAVFRCRGDPTQVFIEAAAEFWRLAQKRGLE